MFHRERIEKPDTIRACVERLYFGRWIGKVRYDHGWETVTTPSFTRLGAKLKLKIWKMCSNNVEFFDL